MFKYALLAAIAAAADSTDDSSDASTDTSNTYSRSGPTVEDSDSNGMMTSTVGFDITTTDDSVTNVSTVGTKLSSGTWGTAGSSKVTTCIKIERQNHPIRVPRSYERCSCRNFHDVQRG